MSVFTGFTGSIVHHLTVFYSMNALHFNICKMFIMIGLYVNLFSSSILLSALLVIDKFAV